MIANTIIRAGETIPKDVVLYAPADWSLAFPKAEQETTVVLWATEVQAQSGADSTDIVVTRILPGVVVVAAPVADSKLKRWSGTQWIAVGTIVVYN